MKNYELGTPETNDENQSIRVSVVGCLDSHTVVDFEKNVNGMIEENSPKRLILDLSDLTYISSAGISALMGLTHGLRKKEGELILLKPSEKIYRVFRTLGFTSIFRIAEDEAALQQA